MIQINPVTPEEIAHLKSISGTERPTIYHYPAYTVHQTELTDECIEKLADAIARRLKNADN